jgi:hypothetical protein
MKNVFKVQIGESNTVVGLQIFKTKPNTLFFLTRLATKYGYSIVHTVQIHVDSNARLSLNMDHDTTNTFVSDFSYKAQLESYVFLHIECSVGYSSCNQQLWMIFS